MDCKHNCGTFCSCGDDIVNRACVICSAFDKYIAVENCNTHCCEYEPIQNEEEE